MMPKQKASQVHACGSPSVGTIGSCSVGGGAELAGPGRRFGQGASDHTDEERLSRSVLFQSHAALESDGWYRKPMSCSSPAAIKVFFVRQ